MNIEAISHHSHDEMCYALDADHLVITLRTGKDIDRVILHYGDPFSAGIMGGNFTWSAGTLEMTERVELKECFLWSATVVPPYKRCRYYFQICSGTEEIYLIQCGFYTKEQMDNFKGNRQDFFFPWMNSADIIAPPAWVNQTIWYQIFPERFCNGDPSISPANVVPWGKYGDTVHWSHFYGGDVAGITSKLDYLKELGITGLYLTPLNLAHSNHKYDTEDYYTIDPHFGDVETVKTMVKEAHARGIRVMFDGVFNHSGGDFKPWMDVVERGPESPYFDWFMINEWPFEAKSSNFKCNAQAGRYYTFGFFDRMPKFNTNNPEVINYFLDVCEYWVKEFDIDALRLDVANEVSHKFCKALRARMDSLKDDFYILGEIWHNAMPWLRGDEYDSVMNYPFTDSFQMFWDHPEANSYVFEYAMNRCFSMYPRQVNDVLFNLLDSHDTIRLVSKLQSLGKFYQQMCVLFTMPGTVCIYYGTEIALEGGHDPDCRRCMPWKEIEEGQFDDRFSLIKTLIQLRKKEDIFRQQSYQFEHFEDYPRVIYYTKTLGHSRLHVLLNCSDVDLPVEEPLKNILFQYGYHNGMIAPDGAMIFKEIIS